MGMDIQAIFIRVHRLLIDAYGRNMPYRLDIQGLIYNSLLDGAVMSDEEILQEAERLRVSIDDEVRSL